jgi:hypothetical protein
MRCCQSSFWHFLLHVVLYSRQAIFLSVATLPAFSTSARVADISRINIFLVHHAVKDVFPARRRERLQCPHLYFPKEETHG